MNRNLEEDSVLAGTHLMNSSDASMTYSDDTATSSTRLRNFYSYPGSSIGTEEEDDDEEDAFSSSSASSSADHYFESTTITNDNDSDDSGARPYIFSDEEDATTSDDSSKQRDKMFQLPRELQHNSNNNNTSPYSSSPREKAGKSIQSPNTWSTYNKRRGRMLAQHLLTKLRDEEQEQHGNNDDNDDGDDEASSTTSSGSSSSEEEEEVRKPRRAKRRTTTESKQRGNLLDRAVKSFRRHRKTPQAARKTAATTTSKKSSKVTTTPSLSTVRNKQVDFGAWERRISPHKKQKKDATRSRERMSYLLDLVEKTTNESSLHRDDNDRKNHHHPVVPVIIKAVSLQCGTALAPSSVNTSALDARATADDVAAQLNLQESGAYLLKKLRAKAGAFDEDDDKNGNEENDNIRNLPLLHLVGDMWTPHFEEYVFRAVHSFGRRLLCDDEQ